MMQNKRRKLDENNSFLKVKSAPVNFTNEQENDLETSHQQNEGKTSLANFFSTVMTNESSIRYLALPLLPLSWDESW